jgi:hypothetical protein
MIHVQQTEDPEPKPLRRHRRWRRHGLVLLLFLLLAVALTYPLAFRLSDAVFNYGDPLLNTWIMAWDVHALKAQPLHLFDANNFYPYENTLAYSENLLTTALLAAPWIWLTDNPVLAHNVLTLLSFTLGGFCAYLLIERLTGSPFGGIVGGFTFAFAHYRFGQISHIQLLTSWWTPLALHYLERFLSERRTRDVVGFSVCFIAQAWATIYLGIFLAGAIVLRILYHVLHCLLTGGDPLKDWSLWARLGAAALLAAAALGLLYPPYSQASEVVGTRELEGQNGAALRDYLTAHPDSLPGRLRALSPVQESPEHTLFPGFVCLALTLWGLVKGRRNWRTMGPYLALGLVSLILSLGPHLYLTRDQPALLEGLPYALLYRYVPLVEAIRVPARLAVLVMLSLAVLTGFGAATLASGARHRRWFWCALAAAGLLLDYAAAPLPLVPIEVGAQVPSVYRWLGSQEADSVIFEFPTAESPNITADEASIPRLSRHQYFSVYHWQRLTMGYSGFYPPLFWESLKHGLHFPSHESIAYLRGLGVRHLLIHEHELSNDELTHTRLGLRRRSDALSELGRFGETRVYGLPSPSPAKPEFELHLPAAAPSDCPYYAYVLLRLPEDQAWVSQDMPSYRFEFKWQPEGGEAISGDVDGELPMVLDSGTTVLPLPLSRPSNWPATLNARFRGLSRTLELTQAVQIRQQGAITDTQTAAAGLQYLAAPIDDDLVLTHAHFPRGRDRTAGDPLSLALYWHRRRSTDRELAVYVHILNQQGLKVAQLDSPLSLAGGAHMPTPERYLVPLPWDLPPGRYDVVAGVYDAQTDQAVGKTLELGSIQLRQPAALESVVQKTSSFRLGESVDLLGYDLAPRSARQGQEITLTLYWRCRVRMQRDYKVFTHLLSHDDNILEQQDGQPRDGRHPTSSWRPGEIVVDRYRLKVPAHARPGQYALAIGMYDPSTRERLSVRGGDGDSIGEEHILLEELQVVEGSEK